MSFLSCSTVSPMLLSHFLTLAHPHPVMVITAASHPPPVLTVSSSYVKLSYCFCFIMSFFSCSTVSPMLLSHFLTLAHQHPVMVITAASHPPPVLTVSSSYVKLLLFLLHYVIFLLLHRLSDVTFTFPNTSSPTSCYGHYSSLTPSTCTDCVI